MWCFDLWTSPVRLSTGLCGPTVVKVVSNLLAEDRLFCIFLHNTLHNSTQKAKVWS